MITSGDGIDDYSGRWTDGKRIRGCMLGRRVPAMAVKHLPADNTTFRRVDLGSVACNAATKDYDRV